MGRPTLITTWYYDVKDLEVTDQEPVIEEEAPEPKKRVITKKVEVKVLMEKETSEMGGPPYALKKVKLFVTCTDPKFTYTGTDIEMLRAAAWNELDGKYRIKWENYYLVTVQPERIYTGFGEGLSFSYDWVYKGTTWDGKELLRQSQYSGPDKISAWPGRFTDKGGRAVACIQATDENKAALEEFGKRIEKLRELISDTLKPENIMQTLQNLAGLALLPPAEKDSNDKRDVNQEA